MPTGSDEGDQPPIDSASHDTVALPRISGEPPINPAPVEGEPLDGGPLEGGPLDGVPLDRVPLDGVPLDGVPLDTFALDPGLVAAAAAGGSYMSPWGEMPGYSDDNNTVLPVGPVGGRRMRDGAAGGGSGAGGGPSTPSPAGRFLVPVALAIVSVVALVAAWTHLGQHDPETVSVGASTISSLPPVPTLSAPAAPTGGASVPAAPTGAASSPTSTPATSTSPSAGTSGPAASSTASPSAPPSSAVAPTDPDRSVPVVVLNATGRPGLASKVAAKLRAQGWNVVTVGNWTRGGVTQTTVFLNGHVRAAATMQRDVSTADVVTLPLAGMPKLRLILVIGPDYPR